MHNLYSKQRGVFLRVEKLVHHQPFQKRLSPPLPGNCGAFVHLFGPGGGALANLARPRGRALGKPGENHGVCLMFGNFKSRTITFIIKNVSVGNICGFYIKAQILWCFGAGAVALYFRPHRQAFNNLSALALRNLPSIKRKQGKFPGVIPGRDGRS